MAREAAGGAPDAALGKAFAEIAPNASFVIFQFQVRVDGTYHFPFISSGFEDLFGVHAGDVAGRGGATLSRVHPDDRKGLLDGIREVHRTLAPWHGEFRVRSPRGEVWVEGRCVGRREPDGSTLWFGVLFDVTERKRIEEALRDSREAFASILEATFDYYWETDVEGRYSFVSPKVTATLGYEPGELLGRTPFDLMSEAEAATGRKLLEDYARRRTPYVAESQRLHKDGRSVALKSSGVPRFGPDGALLGFRGVTRDVTERRRANAMLRASEERFRAIFDVAPVGVAQADLATGRLLAVNPRMTSITGYPAEELLGLTVAEITHPGDLEQDRKMFESLARGEADESRVEKRHIRRDGATAWVNVHVVALRDDGGKPSRTLATIEDITERKTAAAALAASEERYRVLFENTTEGIVAIDPETRRFQFHNPAVCAMFGYTPGEFARMQLPDLHPKEALAGILSGIEAAVRGEGGGANAVPCVRKGGSTFQADIRGSAVEVEGRKIVFGFFTDVTERVRLEEQLRQAQKMEAIGQLAGGVAHDFNNLLTVIGGNCDLLISHSDAADPRRDSLADIRAASERAASLTRQLLAFSRKQILEPKILDLNEAVIGIEKMLRRLIGEDVDLLTDLTAGRSWVKVDPGQLEQVVMNLVVNSRDAMPRGGRITIRTWNVEAPESAGRDETDGQERRPKVALSISDTGTGIPPEVKPHLFEPFFTTKGVGKGTGLGLATVYGIVTQSGGEIGVESEPGKGATFTVLFPSQPAPREARNSRSAQSPLPQGTETVLVVEDEDAVRRIVRVVLASAGYRVIEARGGAEALEAALKHPDGIQIVVTDVVMPEMSGREVAREIEQHHPAVKILYMSGYMDDAIMRHGIVESGVAFLQKPFTPLALAKKVREVLDATP